MEARHKSMKASGEVLADAKEQLKIINLKQFRGREIFQYISLSKNSYDIMEKLSEYIKLEFGVDTKLKSKIIISFGRLIIHSPMVYS